MSARDDYQRLANCDLPLTAEEANRALDEIDRLRGEVTSFLAILHAIDTPLAQSAIDAYNEIHPKP